jgi:DNA polymerase-4
VRRQGREKLVGLGEVSQWFRRRVRRQPEEDKGIPEFFPLLNCITIVAVQELIIAWMPRVILHLDLDAFFCAVEELHSPELRGQPFAVGGQPGQRGVVASCSYAARQYGVHSAMPMSQALRLCPRLLIVSHRRGAYGEMSRKVMERLKAISPLVEQISIDEAFVDVSELMDGPVDLARRLQARINAELGLPCSIGVAANKLTAKIATEVGKKAVLRPPPPSGTSQNDDQNLLWNSRGYPNAITFVPAGEEAAFLAPLPVDVLWGVGPKTALRLGELGIRTIGAVASWPESDLVARFGENGREISHHARGLDDRPVQTERATKSISQEETFARDVRDDNQLERALGEMSAEVARRLRDEHLAGTTVKLKVRWPDFTTLTRQVTLPSATDMQEDILPAALALLKKVRAPGRAVRLIGVGVSGLAEPVRQLGLFGGEAEKQRRLQEVLDELQSKYGERSIRKGGEV